MSLTRRTRAVAQARSREALRDQIILFAGMVALGFGFSAGIVGLAAAGAAMIGYSFRPDADRLYLEGFSDGLVAAETLGADGAPAAGQRGGDQPDVRGLSGEPGAADAAAADGPPNPDQRGAPAAAGGGAEGRRGLRGAFGLDRLARSDSAPLDREGSVVIAQGPRSSGFPSIPAAEPSRSAGGVVEIGTAARGKARRRERPGLREA